MKKIICVMLSLSVLCLSACRSQSNQTTNNTFNFYYCSETTTYNTDDGVIRAEARQAQLFDWTTGLADLINIYFKGPIISDLRSPFPDNVTLNNYSYNNGVLQVILSIQISQLEGYDLTLACACLTKTLLELVPAESVEIRAEGGKMGDSISVSMSTDTLLLIDNCTQADSNGS